jgi:hypothetical protein
VRRCAKRRCRTASTHLPERGVASDLSRTVLYVAMVRGCSSDMEKFDSLSRTGAEQQKTCPQYRVHNRRTPLTATGRAISRRGETAYCTQTGTSRRPRSTDLHALLPFERPLTGLEALQRLAQDTERAAPTATSDSQPDSARSDGFQNAGNPAFES